MMCSQFSGRTLVQCTLVDDIETVIEYWESLSVQELAECDELTGCNLLFFAVQRKSDDEACKLCEYLLENRKCCDAALIDSNGQTAIFFASRDGNCKAVECLIKHGCEAGLTDPAGQTALFYAAREGYTNVARCLLANGCDINARDCVGQTALFYAAREGHLDLIKHLIEHNANFNIRDNQRKRAVFFASKRGHAHVTAYFKALEDANKVEPRVPHVLERAVRTDYGVDWVVASEPELAMFCKEYGVNDIWEFCEHPPMFRLYHFVDMWTKVALDITNKLCNSEHGYWFSKPVDIIAWNCPDYYSVIKRPMDFGTIKKNLRNRAYREIGEFIEDVEQVFKNCAEYNATASPVHAGGESLRQLFIELCSELQLDKLKSRESQLNISALSES